MNKAVAQLGFTIFMFVFFMYAAIEATSFKKLAKYFPLYISLIALVILLIEIIRQGMNLKKEKESGELLHPNIKGVIKYTIILSLYAILVYIIGLLLASVIYVFVFLYFIAEMKLWKSLLTVIILLSILITFGNIMNLYWPKSLLNILMIL